MEEIWLPTHEFEDSYEISNLGRIRSLDRYVTSKNGKTRLFKGKLMSPFTRDNGKGYQTIILCKDGKKNKRYIHRLVAEAFLEKESDNQEVNHKNFKRYDNVVTNLEWCSRLYNLTYMNGHITKGEKRSKRVCQYTLDGKLVKVWPGSGSAERNGGFCREAISTCCNFKNKTHADFVWLYEGVEWSTYIENTDFEVAERAYKEMMIPIVQYTKDGDVVKEWDSTITAEREGGFISQNINCVLKRGSGTHRGFVWLYKDVAWSEYIITKERNRKRSMIPIGQRTLEGVLVKIWESATTAAHEGGFTAQNINAVARGKSSYHRGFKWTYELSNKNK